MEENLLRPFRILGLLIDAEVVDEETGLRDFNKLTFDNHVNYVIEQIKFYGFSEDHVKGLIFCSFKNFLYARQQGLKYNCMSEKTSKEFYSFGRMAATGEAKEYH